MKFQLGDKVLYKDAEVVIYDYSERYKLYTVQYPDRHRDFVDESELKIVP